MNEDILEKVRKDYIHRGGNLGGGSWNDIADRLPSQSLPFRTIAIRVIVILAIPSLFLTGVVGISQASKPGEFLYPVKVASDKVVSKLTNRFEFKIEKRTQEVLDAKDEDTENKSKAQQHEKTSEEPKKETRKSQETRVIITITPEKPEQKFEKTHEESNKGKGVENAPEQAQKVRQEPERGKSEENKGRGKN